MKIRTLLLDFEKEEKREKGIQNVRSFAMVHVGVMLNLVTAEYPATSGHCTIVWQIVMVVSPYKSPS